MTEVVMPQMGESIVEGTLTKWLKKPGERVERDELLFEISTDKVDTGEDWPDRAQTPSSPGRRCVPRDMRRVCGKPRSPPELNLREGSRCR